MVWNCFSSELEAGVFIEQPIKLCFSCSAKRHCFNSNCLPSHSINCPMGIWDPFLKFLLQLKVAIEISEFIMYTTV